MVYQQDAKKKTADNKKEIKVMKKCPVCERRIFDKISIRPRSSSSRSAMTDNGYHK